MTVGTIRVSCEAAEVSAVMPERWPTNDRTWRAFFPYRTDQERRQGVRFGVFANALGNGRFLRTPDDWNRRLCRGNDSAERRARALALEQAWALAFSRTGNPATGEFGDA